MKKLNINRKYFLIFIVLLQISCTKNVSNYTQVVLENNTINTQFIESIEEPEKMLLSWYLLAYGNECTLESDKIKCKLLDLLKIEDECNPAHINKLKKWFLGNPLMYGKLHKCPNFPFKFEVQNTIEKIVLQRSNDTLTIVFKVDGMNTAQEKFWNIEQKKRFLIKKNQLQKIQ